MPTIVFGYFALTFFTPKVLQDLLHLDVSIFNALAAGIIMGFMILPTIASMAEDAMSSVPQSLREGAYGLGASKFQVSHARRLPGGAVGHRRGGRARRLARGRRDDDRARRGGRRPRATRSTRGEAHLTLASFIGSTAGGDTPTGSIEYKTIFAVGMLLFVITLLMNLVAIRFVRKYRQVYE